jgi:hypothetical protein
MTAMKDLTANDYQVWDDTETLTVFSAPRNDLIQFPAKNAFRRALTTREKAASNGAYTGQDLVFLIPSPESQKPDDHFPFKPGDVVVDAKLTSWTVLEAGSIAWTNLWRLVTRNLVLTHGLRNEVTILRPTITTHAGGHPVFSWGPDATKVVENLPARVQLMETTPDVLNDVDSAHERFTVILGQQVTLETEDRIVVTKGQRQGIALEWQAMRNADRIDELPVVECRRV